MRRVRPGVRDVRARSEPTSELIRLDLPTLDRPTTAISGKPAGGNSSGLEAEMTNRALDFMGLGVQARSNRTRGWWSRARGTACTALPAASAWIDRRARARAP